MTRKVGICGLGYVGYPVAMLLADVGFEVVGFLREGSSKEKVDNFNKGINPIKGKEPGLDELAKKVFQKGNFKATTDEKEYADMDYIIIAVQTPVAEENKKPEYEELKFALKNIGRNMKRGVIVIVESTIAPGTMKNIVKPTLEKGSDMVAGEDFHLANCPERLMPGHLLENIRYYNRVVGGWTPECADKAVQLYKHIVEGKLDSTDCITAEIVKAGENTYRDVQIAFANEMALICEKYGADVWKVRELINDCKKVTDTRPEALRQIHFPGAGVGGHCIPKDSWLLISGIEDKSNIKLIPMARYINDFMPLHMYELFEKAVDEVKKDLKKTGVLILGYAYDANSDDDRNTPAEGFIKKLKEKGVEYEIHDSYVDKYKGDLNTMLKGKDAVVLITAHDEYKELKYLGMKELMNESPIIVDGRNVFKKEKAREEGFTYKGVGNI